MRQSRAPQIILWPRRPVNPKVALFSRRLLLHLSLFSVGDMGAIRASKSVRQLADRTLPTLLTKEQGVPTGGEYFFGETKRFVSRKSTFGYSLQSPLSRFDVMVV